jgi:hypothetical protein
MMPSMAQQATAAAWPARYDADPAVLIAIPATRELQISSVPFMELLSVSTLIN